ncbi:hypothetical protein [Arthrobacter sp. CG_A4]|uniref:hypothetical protein n=1 Tax=Arthrobacter sp. CG_A4 TaxID=3071706 RepID=UPI002E00C34B|nr:hypothetical protein [Arthrobacter sp. CG_A4]
MTSPQGNTSIDGNHYEIRFEGQLDQRWSDWFEGFTLINDSGGNTILTGPVIDQAALHGLLRRVGDLGVTLISVKVLSTSPKPQRPKPQRPRKSKP